MAEVDRDIGALNERTRSHADRLDRIEKKLDHIVSVLDNAKGGWKALVLAGSIASAITAALMKAYSFLFLR